MTQIVNKDNLVLLPNDDSHNCFGCSPKNSSGLKMEFYVNKEKDSVFSWLSIPTHVGGWGDIVHGGIVSTILDEAMGWASIVILKKIILTKTMSVNFHKPLFVGEEISINGNILNSTNERATEVEAEIYNSNGELAAKALSTVSLFTVEQVSAFGVLEDIHLNAIKNIWNA